MGKKTKKQTSANYFAIRQLASPRWLLLRSLSKRLVFGSRSSRAGQKGTMCSVLTKAAARRQDRLRVALGGLRKQTGASSASPAGDGRPRVAAAARGASPGGRRSYSSGTRLSDGLLFRQVTSTGTVQPLWPWLSFRLCFGSLASSVALAKLALAPWRGEPLQLESRSSCQSVELEPANNFSEMTMRWTYSKESDWNEFPPPSPRGKTKPNQTKPNKDSTVTAAFATF